uniref:EGF-like domain protein n=1 Tax=Musca domestica TaxID=7370 RepID=A0A1I8M3C5_MUSDO
MSMTTFLTSELLFALLMFLAHLQQNQAHTHEGVWWHKRASNEVAKMQQTIQHHQTPNKQLPMATRSKRQHPAPSLALASMSTATSSAMVAAAVAAVSPLSSNTFDLDSFNHQLSLPSVPLPPPPPFPSNINAISPFGGGGVSTSSSGLDTKPLNAFAFKPQTHSSSPSSTLAAYNCGGVLKARHGIIQTPNFPHKFTTPIECVWVIDASDLISHAGHNISIVVYLTQLYVLGGLKFTEYMYYSDDYKVPAHRVFTLTEDDVTQVAWIQFTSQYLEIRFHMSILDGTHLRALDRLLDVYGFNMTYEVEPVKTYQCNTLQCRFLGHCYAKEDFSSYYCSCFPGFSGQDCGRGPLCEDPHTNICQNGGTCKHIGDAAITCHCPPGFKGTKCEIPDISSVTMGCTANSSALDCHRECDFENSLPKPSRTSARSGKTRYEVTIRLGANLTAYYRNVDHEQQQQHKTKEQLPLTLERHRTIGESYFLN